MIERNVKAEIDALVVDIKETLANMAAIRDIFLKVDALPKARSTEFFELFVERFGSVEDLHDVLRDKFGGDVAKRDAEIIMFGRKFLGSVTH